MDGDGDSGPEGHRRGLNSEREVNHDVYRHRQPRDRH